MIARFLLKRAGVIGRGVHSSLLASILFEDLKTVLDWGQIFLAVVLICALGFRHRVLELLPVPKVPGLGRHLGYPDSPLFSVISGVLFLYEDLPPFAQDILWYNPIMHITGLMREGFYPVYSPGYISVAYTAACALVPMVIGLLLLPGQYHRDPALQITPRPMLPAGHSLCYGLDM